MEDAEAVRLAKGALMAARALPSPGGRGFATPNACAPQTARLCVQVRLRHHDAKTVGTVWGVLQLIVGKANAVNLQFGAKRP